MINEINLIKRFKELQGVDTLANMFISDVIKIIKKEPKVDRWIPCSERLPEEKGWYLVFAKGQRPFVAYFKGKTFPLNNHYHEIVAWQPLPEPYIETVGRAKT